MTSEELNIKLRLDLSGVANGVKKVKTQLSNMANTVKQNIPKINTESKKAEKALNGVAKESRKVRDALDDIGDEAKDSLNDVVTQSKRIKSIFNDIGNSTHAKLGLDTSGVTDSTDSANESLGEMQSTMQGILALDFVTVLAKPFTGLVTKIEPNVMAIARLKKSLKDLKQPLEDLKKTKGIVETLEKATGTTNLYEQEGITVDFLREKINKLQKQIWELRKEALKHFAAIAKSVGLVIAKFAALASVIGAVVLAINAFRTAKLGAEIATSAQQAGFSVQSFQEWRYVLERTGIEATELTEVMKTLTESQVDVINGGEDMTNAYKKLGMSAKEVASMNQEQLWNNTVRALQNVQNTTERTAIAYQLFGEDTAKLTTLLNLSNAETQQLISTYNELGGSMSKSLITNSAVLQNSLLNLRTAWQGLTNTLAQWVLPVIIAVVDWITKAIVVVREFLQTFLGLDLTPMTENLTTGMTNASGALEGVGAAAESAKKEVEKLKRVTMGFDELNIVSNPNVSQDSASGSGGGSGSGAASGLANMGTGESIFMKASEEAEKFKKKVQDFIEKWKTEIAIISGLLATLGVTKLVDSLGKALGLCDKFHTAMAKIQKFAVTGIVIVLQYSLVNEFMDKFIDGKGWKNYIMGLIVSAIGTGVLYAQWGAAGLVIGLGVTAVASLAAVFENGGIDSVESAVTALTGLAAAIGAVYTAWTKLNLGSMVTKIGTWIGSLGTTFTKIGGVIGGAVKAVGTFVGALTSGTVLTIAGIVTAIASAAYFLYENWDKVTKATKDWIDTNIKPILDDIKGSWDKLCQSVKDVGSAIVDAMPDAFVEWLKDVGDWIGKTVKKFKEWFDSVEWIKGIGKAVEGLGAIITTIVGGVIMGFIQGTIKAIEGVFQVITGLVEIVSGAVEAIVRLCTGDLKGAWDACKKIGKGIEDVFVGLYDATIGVVVEWVKGIINWCTELWDELVGHSIIPDMVNAIIEWFNTLYDNTIGVIVKFAKDIISKLKTMWSEIVSWFNSNIKPKFTKEYWNAKFDTIRQSASDKLNAAKKVITDIWGSITSWFKSNIAPKFTVSYWTGKFNTIKDGARSAFNGVISVIEKAINSIIKKINTLSWEIPDWVPVFGGDEFGFNFRTISIPRLATGGITNGSVLANIGENGREAVLPLENNTGWMDTLAEKLTALMGNGQKQDVVLKIGEEEFGRVSLKCINGHLVQTGGLALA